MMGAEPVENQRIAKIEKWIFYFMGGFALSSSLSIAAANIFLSLGLVAALWRLWYKHDDLGAVLRAKRGVTIAFCVLFAATLLSGLSSPDPVWSLRLFGDYYGYRMVGLYVVLVCVRDKRRLCWLAGLTMLSISLNNIYTVGLGLFRPATNRPAGFMSYMAQAGILSAAIPVFLLAAVYLRKRSWRQMACLALIIATAAILYNATRGAWIAAGITAPVGAFLLVEDKKKWLFGCFAAFIALAGCFAVSPRLQHYGSTFHSMEYQSNHERMLIWQSAFHMFEDHPLLGVGFGQFEDAYHTKYISPEAKEPGLGHAHSNVMQMLGERGALGCLAFMGMWVYFVVFGIRGWLRERNIAYLAWFAIVMGVMLQGLTEYNMGTTVVTKFYWFVLGICLQWIILSEEEMKS